jgi:hypothetical protein
MTGVHHTETAQTVAVLQDLLGVALDQPEPIPEAPEALQTPQTRQTPQTPATADW